MIGALNSTLNGSLASLTACALCFAGMAALSLAMDRHYEQVAGASEWSCRHRWVLRPLGWLLLAASLWPCITAWGIGVGLTAWCGWLTAGAMAVAWTLPYIPRWTAGAAALSGVGALLSLALN